MSHTFGAFMSAMYFSTAASCRSFAAGMPGAASGRQAGRQGGNRPAAGRPVGRQAGRQEGRRKTMPQLCVDKPHQPPDPTPAPAPSAPRQACDDRHCAHGGAALSKDALSNKCSRCKAC